MFAGTSTYHHTVSARNFVKAGRVGLSPIGRTALLVGVIEDVEDVVIRVVANKDIGDELQE